VKCVFIEEEILEKLIGKYNYTEKLRNVAIFEIKFNIFLQRKKYINPTI
jgi:hypothetical protein